MIMLVPDDQSMRAHERSNVVEFLPSPASLSVSPCHSFSIIFVVKPSRLILFPHLLVAVWRRLLLDQLTSPMEDRCQPHALH